MYGVCIGYWIEVTTAMEVGGENRMRIYKKKKIEQKRVNVDFQLISSLLKKNRIGFAGEEGTGEIGNTMRESDQEQLRQ